ncbi:MAG: ATP-dependent RNA helicase HrpA [Betaproteobacteria bacterium]|nr:ATP-dependent RNA helicase HrpA [Betaproteobacteria bacterium]
MPPTATPRFSFEEVLSADRGKLIALDKKRRDFVRAGKAHDQLDQQFDTQLSSARARFAAKRSRHALVATPTFDDALPIAERRAEIAELIRAHQVVIVCGETGSGKTTQLPKICLELGRGINGMIGCTQPRRIAARSLATRLAKELGAAGSHAVGYKIRFNDHTDENTFVKIMTDGILLAETHSDHSLWAYDTLIIDEAHERSLNIDFLLGYVKQLMAKRPDLKIIITSATIDPQRFSKHFDGAPIIEVSGRTYPVEVRYRPEHFLDDAEDAVPIEDAVVKAVDEIFHETHEGDVLVFLPGEREIRDCDEALRKHHPAQTEVLPLYSRLSNAEQDRVFQLSGRRRIVLATNVAETSLTVPGIRFVIDAGVARINRYSTRSKINQLQIEAISQASAQQRSGRCGRVASGIAVRLYSEEDFNGRPPFTTPEILRTSLADVILRMKSLGLGDVQDFPFIEPPSPRMIEDGYRQLFELGAVDESKGLTALGWKLAKFPVDPAIARMLLAAEREACVREVLVIASALSVQDPRVRPHDKQQEAAIAHEKFAHPQSEFLAFVNLWTFYEEAWKHKKSHRKFDQMLHENFLSPMRMREWRDVHAQLVEVCASAGMHVDASPKQGRVAATANPPPPAGERSERRNSGGEKKETASPAKLAPAHYDNIHRALLTGLISNVGTKGIEGDHYLGTRGIKFQLPRRNQQHAAQKAARMKWVMAAELTETTRVYARTVASIEPEWIEQLAAHLVTRTHFEPHWERKSGQVVAFEQVSIYGLVINPRRRVHYGAINPVEAREIFIRQGLVAGEVDTTAKFLRLNQKLIEDIEDIEAKARRQDVLIDDDDMFALYDAAIPADVVNMAGFEKWRREAEKKTPGVLEFTREQLMRRGANEITFELFPKSLKHRGAVFPLAYRFEPAHMMDGVTITLPVAVLNQVNAARFEWLTMGMLRDKVTALFKALPQKVRSQIVPVPETVSEFIGHVTRRAGMNDLSAAEMPLIDAMTAFLRDVKRMDVVADAWDVSRLQPHLLMNFRIVDADGKELAMSRDFAALKAQFADASRTVFSTLHRNRLERDDITKWDFEALPETINFERNQIRYDGYPALVDRDTSVSIKIFDERQAARHSHRRGLTRLFMLELAEQVKFLERGIKLSPMAAFQYVHFFPESKNHTQDAMRKELVFAAFAGTMVDTASEEIRSEDQFAETRAAGKPKLAGTLQALVKAMEESFAASAEIRKLLDERYVKTWEHIGPEIEDQLRHLFEPEFLRNVSMAQLLHFPRYLKAIVLRLNKARAGSMERDLEQARSIRPLWQNALKLKDWLEPKAAEYRWMIEELRVSLFAQELRTPFPVSVKRVTRAWEELEKK